MDPIDPVHGTTTLLLIAAIAVVVLLFLIIKVKLHAFIALVLISVVTAVAAGIPLVDVPTALTTGFGSTLASVALLVGFGVMLGRLLEVTGGAQVLADTLVNRFGEKRAPLALGVAALIFGLPIFFDAGLVVFLPIILTVARRFGGSLLFYALPAAGAFAAMHALVPPHPGPVAAGTVLGGDIGVILLVNLPIALIAWYVGVYRMSKILGRRFDVGLPSLLFGEQNDGTGGTGGTTTDTDTKTQAPPSFGLVLGLLMMVTRRQAVSQVVGFMAMENGLFLAAVTATSGMPLVVELGVAFDILVAAVLFGVFFLQIRDAIDSLDVDRLNRLAEGMEQE